ncbi:15383_t:CDS:2 [Cetraspora pellucida]|uniref:15383_t:CDS:1 n=1 Tax=Cetraspora pellucida TaxID=1433469 RepID=A0A9N9I0X6_9GLOM|nr:15383_t:CDS:2 [Cetraspora pellucida]
MNISCVFAQFNNTTSYPITQDGTCGVSVNRSCGNFDCCSQDGYCGGTADGCQKDYGFCGLLNDSLKIINSCQSERTLALTFDDGPRPWTNELLDELKKHDIKATFFFNGHNALNYCIYDYADIVRRIYDEGHQFAHHTWSHPHMAQVTPKEVNYQIDKLETAFIKILGVIPRFFRLPFGEGMNYDALRTNLIQRGYKFFALWDIDTNDFLGNETIAKELFLNGISDAKPHIVLNHDRVLTTVEDLVPFNIENAIKAGYTFDTLAGCNGMHNKTDWYKVIGERQKNDSTWICTPDDMHIP